MKISHAKMKASRAADTRPGNDIGRIMRKMMSILLAPSTIAESSISVGMESKYAFNIQTVNGNIKAV
jgi:hypothetical protein